MQNCKILQLIAKSYNLETFNKIFKFPDIFLFYIS